VKCRDVVDVSQINIIIDFCSQFHDFLFYFCYAGRRSNRIILYMDKNIAIQIMFAQSNSNLKQL
jgi:hypothetical protein